MWTLRDEVSGATVSTLPLPSPPSSWHPGVHLWALVLPFDTDGTLGLMGAMHALHDDHAAAIRAALTSETPLDALAALLVGPILPAALAAREALASDHLERHVRADWLFPGEDLTDDELDDPEVFEDLLAAYGWTTLIDEDDPEEREAIHSSASCSV